LVQRERARGMVTVRCAAAAALAAVVLSAGAAGALEFDLVDRGTVDRKPGDAKCVMEELNDNVLVIMDYESLDGTAINSQVYDPKGELLHAEENHAKGQWAFTTDGKGDYKACFEKYEKYDDGEHHKLETHKIKLEWKTGVAATDWEGIAKRDHLDAMAMSLRKLEAEIKELHEGMLYMRKREMEMRDINESTNSKVAWLSVMSLGVSAALSIWQLVYLKNFFKRKKML